MRFEGTPSSRTRFHCVFCHLSYSYAAGLRKHIRMKHKEDQEERSDVENTIDEEGS